MSLSPEEIAAKRFVVALRGYDKDEVDAFLQEVAAELARLVGQAPPEPPPVEDSRPRLDRFAEQIDTLILTAAQVAEDIRAGAEAEAAQVKQAAEALASQRERQGADAIARQRAEWEAERDRQRQALERERAEAQAQVEGELAKVAAARQAAEKLNQNTERQAAAVRERLEQKWAQVQQQEAHTAELHARATQELADATSIREAAEREAASRLAKAREDAERLQQRLQEGLRQSLETLNAISLAEPEYAELKSARAGESAADVAEEVAEEEANG